MKVKVMRKVSRKKSQSLAVNYGIKPELAIPLVTHIDSRVAVDIGWIKLYFGYDEKWSEVLFAITEKDTFLLSDASSVPPVLTGAAKICDWVYAVGGLPPDFYDGAKEPTMQEYCGFHVEHGVDFDQREFVFVGMPNAELQLLFRNPSSPLTQAWSHRRAISLDHSMVIGPFAGARALVCGCAGADGCPLVRPT